MMLESPDTDMVEVDDIRTDGGTQPRANIDARLVTEYAEAMTEESVFPAVTVFFDGQHYWLADGFHRVAAVKAIGLTAVPCLVKQGTRDDAIWYSCGANATHGRRRSNQDKRRAVETALADPRAETLSNRELARHCGVSHTFVAKMRAIMSGEIDEDGQIERELDVAPTPQAISAAESVTATGVDTSGRDDGYEPSSYTTSSSSSSASEASAPVADEDGFFEMESSGGGGGGDPAEVSIAAAEERPAAEKRSIKLPRDPEQAAHVILKNFTPEQVEHLIAVLESNLAV